MFCLDTFHLHLYVVCFYKHCIAFTNVEINFSVIQLPGSSSSSLLASVYVSSAKKSVIRSAMEDL